MKNEEEYKYYHGDKEITKEQWDNYCGLIEILPIVKQREQEYENQRFREVVR